MKILLTGGAGFIGSHLTERLLRENCFICCLDDFNEFYDPRIKKNNISPFISHSAYELIEGNILDEKVLVRLFQANTFDAIIHFAARAGVRPSINYPLLYQEVNVRGTQNLLEMAVKYSIPKFIFASSSSVYGNNKKVPFSENDFVDHPVSPYAATKKAGELLCYTYHHLYDLHVACLRFFTVYGPGQRPDMAIHKFTRLIHEGQKIPVFGDGTTKRDYTYITDIIDGVVSSLERCSGYRIYNLGESRTVELRRLIELIEKNLGKRADIEQLPLQPGDVPITYADVSRAKKELDYNPQVPIEEGIKRYVAWFLEKAA